MRCALVKGTDPRREYFALDNYVTGKSGRDYHFWLESNPVGLGEWLLAESERVAPDAVLEV